MTYDCKRHFNAGDYVQSLAARQFLPKVDQYINREKLNEYRGAETKMIMNGWFMLHPENWPPSPNINPLFISFHLNKAHSERVLSEQGVAYLRKYKIGCRDNSTLNLLKAKGIDVFLSSCLTLTLGNSYKNSPGEDIYFVDVLFKFPTLQKVFRNFRNFRKSITNREIFQLGRRKKLLGELFGEKIVKAAKIITHDYSAAEYPDEGSRFELAENLLKRYQKAKLVVTSRIHCALPCLAMGTPVIYVDVRLDSTSDKWRLDGIRNLFNVIEISGKEITANFDYESVKKTAQVHNKTCHLEYVELLNRRCKEFISDNT
jgi:hypothetical protein